ncbi:GntR family transcriptional regulator [Ensifer sp. MPMI2T]|nr:GntR family transcriptional regulator [Ensifer sp. MPMI2T]
MIIEGELQPGERLYEIQLCESLGVSRTPLREALKSLAGEGLVELVPGKGAVVRKFTKKDVHDMLVVIRSMEELAARLACEVASDEDIARIREIHNRMEAHFKAGERMEYYKLNQQIHTSLVALADNPHLAAFHSTLQAQLKRIRFIGHEGPELWAAAMAEHERIVTALEARDADRLVEVIGQHLHNAWLRVKEAV